MGQSLTTEQRTRLCEVRERLLTALNKAAAQSVPVTDTERQRGCVEVDWTLDAPHTQHATDELDEVIEAYVRDRCTTEDVGFAFNAWLDAHRIAWRKGIPTIFRRV